MVVSQRTRGLMELKINLTSSSFYASMYLNFLCFCRRILRSGCSDERRRLQCQQALRSRVHSYRGSCQGRLQRRYFNVSLDIE